VTPALTRPVVALLETALATPSPSLHDDVGRLRDAVAVALGRCLADPPSSPGWPELVVLAGDRGGWDRWRVAALVAAGDPASDPDPAATRDALATLAGELVARRGLVADTDADVTASARSRAGRDRRELVFAIEAALDHAARGDAAGLVRSAEAVERRDPAGTIRPGLAAALRAGAHDVERTGWMRASSLARLRAALDGTPFAAAVDLLRRP